MLSRKRCVIVARIKCLGDDDLGQRHHLGVHVEDVAFLPPGEAPRRVVGHDFAVRRDALSMERGLDEPALSQPGAALGKKQAVADQPAEKKTHARTLDEVPVARDQDILDRVGVVHEEGASRPESNRHEIAVLARACGVEAKLIASEGRAASEEEVPFWSSRFCLRGDAHRSPAIVACLSSRLR